MNQGEVADMFGIDRTTVSKLVKRRHEFLEFGEEMAIEATVAAERALYDNPVPAKRTKTDSLGEFFKKFNNHARNRMERKPLKYGRSMFNTIFSHENWRGVY